MSEKKIVKRYLHSNKEDSWDTAEELWPGKPECTAAQNYSYALYEVAFDLEVDLDTGDYQIIAVDGKKLCQ